MLQPASVTLDGHVKPGAAAHGPIDAITIPDAHLLFSGDFKRAGTDLILSDETQRFVVHDYFRGEHHQTLLSPDGAGLAADVVDALTGHGAYAQAAATPNAVVAIGRVAEVAGSATIVRNGVAITANAGDALLKGDVLQTGAGTLGVTFNDGSTLNLTANSRLMVDDFVYDSNGSANSEILNLVQGSLTFISGGVAHSGGDMKITTPVATMGIRGTVGGITESDGGKVSFFVVQSELGAVITDNQGHVLAQVVQNGPLIQVVPTGPLQVLAQEIDKSPQELAAELAALQQIVSLQAVGQQILELFLNPNSTTPNHTQIEIDIPKTALADQGTFGANDNNSNTSYTATVTTTTTDQNGTTTTTTDQLVTQPNPAPQNSGTTVYWTGASDSNSANNANWSPAAPSSSNDVIIGRDQNDNPVPDATVAAGSPIVVHSLTLSDGAHLEADDVSVGGDIAIFGNAPTTTEITGGLTIYDLGGNLFLHATTGNAEIRSIDDLIIGSVAGSFTVEAVAAQCASAHAEIVACGPDLTIGDIHGNFLLSATIADSGNAVARIASENVRIGDVSHNFTVAGGADSCSPTFAEISATCGDLVIGNIGGDFLNGGLIDADNGLLSIGTVGGSFVNDGVMRAYELEIAANDNGTLDNHGKIIVNSGSGGGGDDTSTIGVAVHNSGFIKVTDTLLDFDGHVQNLDCGVILGGHGSEIDFNGGVSNSALIKASYGGEIDFNSHVFNSGTIEAANCGSIYFDCGGVDNCGLIQARHDGGISFYDSVFNSDMIAASHGGEIDFHGSVHNSGTIEAASCGSISFETNWVDNCGTVEARSDGTINFDHWVGGNGTLAIDGGAIELASGTCNTIDFSGGCGGTLVLDNATASLGQITGFGPDDSIDLAGLSGVSIFSYTETSGSSGILELQSNLGDFDLSFTGDCTNYTVDNFVLSFDENGAALTEAPTISYKAVGIADDPDDSNSTDVSGLSILEPFGGNDRLTITAVADHGTLAALGCTNDLTLDDDGSDGTLSGSGTLDAINRMLSGDIKYTPNANTPTDMVSLTISDLRGETDAINFVFNVSSGGNDVTLQGVSGEKNVLFATGQNDTLIGNGNTDTFFFGANESGDDHIADFHTASDFIYFESTLFAPNETVVEILQSATSNGGNAVITANDATITFDHVTVAQLQSIDQSHVILS